MDKYNFEPDFKKWWNKKSLTEEELLILVFGINPDQYKKYLVNYGESPEDENFAKSFRDFLGKRAQHSDISRISEVMGLFKAKNRQWKGKEDFIKYAYENGFDYIGEEISDDLVKYLKSIDEMPIHFDKYRNFNQYKSDLRSIALENIKTEEEAFSHLLGLNPEFFLKFFSYTRDRRTKNISWSEIEPETRFFVRRYYEFLKSEFIYYDFFGEEIFFRALTKAQELLLWEGKFCDYAQSLKDEGFIFRAEIYESLKTRGINLAYSENCWATNFFRRWLKEGIWSFQESLSLFGGQHPQKGRSYQDLSQNPYTFTDKYFWENFEEVYLELDDRLKRHIAAGLITPVTYKDKELFFTPKSIVKWLLEHIPYSPPEPLLKCVLDNDDFESHYKRQINVVTSITGPSKEEIESVVRNANQKKGETLEMTLPKLYEFAMPIMEKFEETHKRAPTKKEVANSLKEIHPLTVGESSVVRALSAKELKLRFIKFKKEKAAA